ncbi:hypothetical protein GLOTRDRAFT_118651 [Gloeophyllum trabeum ATCC 11539]|uniref:Uncharacterized protein n=1 Tax=Gloeophyllum trabeum (strain ATCC 11539 / FP-39264 / Madison 617) TaxID=670483 RepID=S7RZB9_GLOTA|nr:uncharacterized protein GLOTRDRAFT_118651 [Gloeophyllum trabeum ATCC 11539]EPQ60345.1 hypothetical protein GLOTRDRAFT_118651 [Gloeophyllum trabeum ATCC 11539]
MWIAHYASGLVAKPFAPGVPLWLLALAGALPDAVFFVLNFLGIESFQVDPGLQKKGCFPYATDYPYSHSLAGMFVVGAILAAVYKTQTRRQVSFQDLAVITLTSGSHFLLEWPSHRADVKVMPHDNTSFGAGLFDHPGLIFVSETLIFLAGLWVYTSFAPLATRSGYKQNMNWFWAVIGVMVMQQAQFSLNAAPTTETRWVHAPAFLGEILGSAWLLGKLEG